MKPVVVTAATMTNACGIGMQAIGAALRDGRSGLRRNDFEPAGALDTFIGRVDALESIEWPERYADYDCRNNRLAWLALDQDGFRAAVATARARHGAGRIGVFVGTSTSGILTTEMHSRATRNQAATARLSATSYAACHSMYAPARFLQVACELQGIAATLSTACSSSAKVFGSAARALHANLCDAAIVAGIDSLALSTLHGFNALELLSRMPCRPFDSERDGISIGEGAGLALLERDGEGDVALTGIGESADAWHMSSPHPEGAGAARAMRGALRSAGVEPDAIDYINLHGTATRANDAAEDHAVHAVFGGAASAGSTKGWTGHALGAAGITEALICVYALREQWRPGTLNCVTPDPALRSRIDRESSAATLRHVLSNSFGFGGNNCSLVFGMQR
jgi:3-oxoacyl-[acyl-carrier-protein] synthase-1